MNEDKIQNQIKEVVETSPAETKVEASKPIEAPSYSTLRTGMPEEMQTAPVAQYETTPDRGIEFTKNTDEVITGGTAIPGLGYDTRFQTVDDMGDPLYFEPNLQPVVPYPLGPMETDTLNPNKANWQLMKNNFGARDQDYIGYYLLPEQGSLSWWDFFGGQVNKDIGMLVPRTLQGATGVITSALKMPFLGAAAYQSGDYKNIEPDPKLQQILKGAGLQGKDWAPMIDRIRTIAPESDTGSLFNELMKQSPSEAVRLLNQLQDIVDGAVSPLDETATLLYDADPEDKSFKAQSARAIGSGYTTFGSAALSKIPEVMFTLYNFAGAGQLRRNALNYGVSPSWAEVYSIGGSAVNSMLDMVEFAGLVNSGSLLKQGGKKALENLKNKGILKAIERHAPREAIATGGEIVVESAQTGIEGAYDEDFREHPLDALVLSGLSVMALKIGTLPVSVRHANAEERAKVAEYLGVDKIYNAILKDSVAFADDLISKGALEPSQKQAFLDDLWANAPDTVIKTLREGVKGELDKIPANEIKNFAQILKDVNRNYQGQVFSPKTIMKLDQEVETNIANIRNGLSDSEIDMMKGVVRGAYVLSAIANANNPDYKGFQVPTFVITKNRDGYSYYDQKKNEIGLHEGRSNTEYTNNSPTYAARLDSGFVPASRQSDKMASILHEMSHWMDSMVGEKGFGDFLEYYYNSIATAFGKDTARRLYTQSEIKNKSKGRPREYFAQTIGRMGKRAAEAFGLGKSQANRFLSYANIMMNQLANLEGRAGEKLSQSIADFQTALQEVTKANMEHLSDLIEVYGSDNIKQALANFNKDSEGYGDFAEYLANQDMLKELFDVMDSFADAAGVDKIKDLFDGDQNAMDNFVTMGDKLFREGYDKAVEEVRQRKAEAKKTAPKPVEAKRDLNNPLVLRDLIVSETDDSSKVHEEGLYEEGTTDYETQDWARAAMAKDSIKESFEAGKKPKKQIAADTVINGNDLSADITLAQQGLSKRLANPMNKVVKWAASSPWGWGLDRILVTVLGRDAAEHLDVQGKYSAKQNIRSKYWDEFMERLKPVLGNPESARAMMFRYKTMVNNLGFVRMKGLEVINPTNPDITSTRDITGWEAMYVYLMQQQGFGDRVQKGTTTKIDDIIATLSDDEKAFAMAMSDQLMSMYEKTFGKSKYAHYFPILDAEHELFGELSIDSLTARQNTDDTIAIADAGRIFSQYVSRWASHESGYFQTLKRVRDIFRYTGNDQFGPEYVFDAEQDAARMRASAQVADMTRQAIGEDGYRNLLNNVNSELAEPQEQMFDATRNHTLTQMGNNIIKSILANKAVSFPKNVANLFMFWGGAKDQGRYWNSFAEGWGHMKDTYEYMMEHSGEIKQRWGSAGGINEYIDQRSLGGSTAPVMKGVSKIFAKMEWNGDKTQNMAKFSAAMDMLGDAGLKVFMQSGDMIANVFGGYALVKDYMAQGLSEADAFKKLDRYIVEHQSSSNLAMKPLVQKQFNRSILGQLFAFTSEGVAKWASILGTFDEANMGTATKSEAVANVVSIAISMALYSAIAAGAWDLLDDDEKVREEAEKALVNTAIDQVFGGLVAGNAMITPAISYLVGDSRISGMSVPIYNFALDGITALKKGDYDRVLFKALSAAGLPIGADNVWTSLFGASLLNDPNPDVRYAGRLMLAGYTPNRATKRAGIKKESLEKNDEE